MLRFCLDCSTAYAVDLQFCPNCGSTRHGYSKPAERLSSSGTVETLVPRQYTRSKDKA